MGPKRKQLPTTDSGQTSKQPKKSRSDDVTTPVIDYDLLTDAIIRNQNINKVSSNASDSSTSVDTVSDNTRSSTMLVENSVQQQPSTSEMHATRTITPLVSEQNTGTSATTFSQQPQTSASTFASTSDFSNMLNQLFSGGQSLGPMIRFPANSTTTTHDLHLSPISQQLLCAALSSATQKAFLRSWKRFYEFCLSSNSFFQVPCSLSLICNFIGHLHSSNSSFSCFCN